MCFWLFKLSSIGTVGENGEKIRNKIIA